jgi:hypothetical protein
MMRPCAAAHSPHRFTTVTSAFSELEPASPNVMDSVPEPRVPASAHAEDAAMTAVAVILSDVKLSSAAALHDPSRVSKPKETCVARAPPPAAASTAPDTMPETPVLVEPGLRTLVNTCAWSLNGLTVV